MSHTPESEWEPTRVTDRPWVSATRPKGPDERQVSHGMWLVWLGLDGFDDAWIRVVGAVERGELGYAAKAMTAGHPRWKENTRKGDVCDDEALIVVYTQLFYPLEPHERVARYHDADATRIRERLRALGVTWKIPFRHSFVGRTRRFE